MMLLTFSDTLPFTFETLAVLDYFSNSNVAGKIIVIMLVLFSFMAWTVMIGKFLDLSRLRGLNQATERKLLDVRTVFEMSPRGDSGPYGQLIKAALESFARYGGAQEGYAPQASVQIAHVENALQRAVAKQSIRYESRMVLLGSIVTGAPFMGLLGTVWGVMDAFGGMEQSTATLQALAPGVSGALLTTVAGLLVAIPSVFGYNFLLTQAKIMVTELENFASTLADRVELEISTGAVLHNEEE